MNTIVLVMLACGLWLNGCSGLQATDARGVSPEPRAPTPVAAAVTPTPTAVPLSSEAPEVGLYLTSGETRPADLLPDAVLEALPLQAEPLLTHADIIAYEAATHAFTLTTTATERLAGLEVPVAGPVFVLTVAGEPVYAGAFWTPLSSLSYDGVVIMLMPDGTPAFGDAYRIELGYPGSDFFHGDDPRGDPRILDALAQAGKLTSPQP